MIHRTSMHLAPVFVPRLSCFPPLTSTTLCPCPHKIPPLHPHLRQQLIQHTRCDTELALQCGCGVVHTGGVQIRQGGLSNVGIGACQWGGAACCGRPRPWCTSNRWRSADLLASALATGHTDGPRGAVCAQLCVRVRAPSLRCHLLRRCRDISPRRCLTATHRDTGDPTHRHTRAAVMIYTFTSHANLTNGLICCLEHPSSASRR